MEKILKKYINKNEYYAVDLARATRPTEADVPEFVGEQVIWGAGPRASQALILCAKCHVNTTNPEVLAAADGFIIGNQQFTELQAGPHAVLDCVMCHDPHKSVAADRSNAIRNPCRSCHPLVSMAMHDGLRFIKDMKTNLPHVRIDDNQLIRSR